MTPELDAVLAEIPELAGRERTVAELPGGLTNTNVKVTTDRGAFVVRRWSPDTGLLAIDRDNEYENSVRAAEVGIGAPVVAYLPAHNALVLGFVDGRVLSAHELRRGEHLPAVAQSCRRLHAARPFRDDFSMFDVQAGYLTIVTERGFRLPDRYLEFHGHVEALRQALAVREERPVPCHNDLLAENLLLTGDRLWFIDYEYSGNNEPSFELGNLWSESNLSADQLEGLVGCYYGSIQRHKVARARLWATMAKYGWTLWASIQDGVSDIDFDFWAWGMEKYERAVAEFESPEFERLLDEARRAD